MPRRSIPLCSSRASLRWFWARAVGPSTCVGSGRIVDCRVRETIELRDVIDSEEIAAVDFDDLPLNRSDQLANEKAAANRAQNETT